MAEIATVKVKLTDEHQKQIIELCERLKAENARLRKSYEELAQHTIVVESDLMDYVGQYDPTDAKILELKKENERLRELACDMLRCIHANGCDGCEWFKDDECSLRLAERYEEFGIEVD